MAASVFVIALLLIGAKRFLKKDRAKELFLKLTALAVVFVHYSPLYEDYLRDGEAMVADNMLFAVYPCNLAMWLLLIYAFISNKKSLVARVIGEFTFYLGIVGGIIGIAANINYSNTPDLGDWGIFAGLLSHSVMLLGCFWLLVGNYIRIRVRNTLSVMIGMVILFLDGFVIIRIFRCAGLTPPNSMFLLGVPYKGFEWANTAVIGAAVTIIVFIFTWIYEMLALPADQRTLSKKTNKRVGSEP